VINFQRKEEEKERAGEEKAVEIMMTHRGMKRETSARERICTMGQSPIPETETRNQAAHSTKIRDAV